MEKVIYILIIVALLILIWRRSEHLMVPGVDNRQDTEAGFLDDREWFDKNEKDFYSRYRT
jgi:hypothetical protein